MITNRATFLLSTKPVFTLTYVTGLFDLNLLLGSSWEEQSGKHSVLSASKTFQMRLLGRYSSIELQSRKDVMN